VPQLRAGVRVEVFDVSERGDAASPSLIPVVAFGVLVSHVSNGMARLAPVRGPCDPGDGPARAHDETNSLWMRALTA